MRFVDAKGRVFGWINIIDLTVAVVAVLAGAAMYAVFSAPHRAAPESLRTLAGEWVEVTLQLPPERGWLAESVRPGQRQFDPRTGGLLAEIEAVTKAAHGSLAVRLKCLAIPEAEGRYSVDGKMLVPGEELRVAMEECVLEGRVRAVQASDAPDL